MGIVLEGISETDLGVATSLAEADGNYQLTKVIDNSIVEGAADADVLTRIGDLVSDEAPSAAGSEIATIAMEHICQRLGMKVPMTVATESNEEKPSIASEDFKEAASKVWEAIKKAFQIFWDKLMQVIESLFNATTFLKQKSDKIKDAVSKIKGEKPVRKMENKATISLLGDLFCKGGDTLTMATIGKYANNHLAIADGILNMAEHVNQPMEYFKKLAEDTEADDYEKIKTAVRGANESYIKLMGWMKRMNSPIDERNISQYFNNLSLSLNPRNFAIFGVGPLANNTLLFFGYSKGYKDSNLVSSEQTDRLPFDIRFSTGSMPDKKFSPPDSIPAMDTKDILDSLDVVDRILAASDSVFKARSHYKSYMNEINALVDSVIKSLKEKGEMSKTVNAALRVIKSGIQSQRGVMSTALFSLPRLNLSCARGILNYAVESLKCYELSAPEAEAAVKEAGKGEMKALPAS